MTARSTTKYRNLKKNPEVSLLVDSRHVQPPPARSQLKALTIHGVCRQVDDLDQAIQIRDRFLHYHPHLQRIAEDEDTAFLIVDIHYLLLLDGPVDSHYVSLQS